MGIILRITALRKKAHLVPEPLYHRTAHEYRSFKRVLHLAVKAYAYGGYKAVFAHEGLVARIHQQKAACAVGILCVARVKAGLTEKRRLLIAGDSRYRHLAALKIRIAVYLAAIAHLGQHGTWNIQRLQQRIVPVQSVYIEQHGAGSVGVIRDVHLAARELPEKPCVNGAKEYLAPSCPLPRAVHPVQYPFYLAAGKIGVRHKAGNVLYMLPETFFQQAVHYVRRSPALPDYCIIYGLSGIPVPQHGRLALVGYAYSGDLLRRNAGLRHSLHHHAVL